LPPTAKKSSNYGLFLGGGTSEDNIKRSKSEAPHKSSVGGNTIDSNEGKESRDRSNPNRAIFLQDDNKSIRSKETAEQPKPQ
jgi:hypothetical protein